MVFRRKLCNLLFGAAQDKEQAVTSFMADLLEWLHNIHQYLKVASCRCLANSAGLGLVLPGLDQKMTVIYPDRLLPY
jgi:hypothetical protein